MGISQREATSNIGNYVKIDAKIEIEIVSYSSLKYKRIQINPYLT